MDSGSTGPLRPGPRRAGHLRRLVPAILAVVVLATVAIGQVVLAGGEPGPSGPEPLRLDPAGATGFGMAADREGDANGMAGSREGSGVRAPTLIQYQIAGALPNGPAEGSVYQLPGAQADPATVGRLAAALGLTGSPKHTPEGWSVASVVGQLLVADEPGLPWNFRGATPAAAGTTGPARAAAARMAEPVLAAVGLAPAEPTITAGAPLTLVTVDPVVDGLPTAGFSTVMHLTADGPLYAGGWLAKPTRGDTYPLVGAREAVAAAAGRRGVSDAAGAPRCPDPAEQPTATPGAEGSGGSPGTGSPGTGSPSVVAPKVQPDVETDQPIPLPGTPGDPDSPTPAPAGPGAADRPGLTGGGFAAAPGLGSMDGACRLVVVTLTEPRYGLSWRLNGTTPLLVPSWLFRTDRGDRPAAFVAVHPDYLRG